MGCTVTLSTFNRLNTLTINNINSVTECVTECIIEITTQSLFEGFCL